MQVKLYNPDLKLASVMINDAELYHKLRNHFLTYKIDNSEFENLSTNCIISSTTIQSVLEVVDEMVNYTEKIPKWCSMLQSLREWAKPGYVILHLVKEL